MMSNKEFMHLIDQKDDEEFKDFDDRYQFYRLGRNRSIQEVKLKPGDCQEDWVTNPRTSIPSFKGTFSIRIAAA